MPRFLPANRAVVAELAALVLGGIATCLAYPPSAVPGLGLVMLAPIAWLLDRVTPRRAFLYAWLYSLAFAFWLCRFVVHALVVEYEVALAPSVVFTAIVIGLVALVPAAAGAAYAAVRPPGVAAGVVFAAIWTLGEWLRGSLLGVPWLLAVQTQTRWPTALQLADAGGQYAVSFAVIAISAGLGIALARRDLRMLALPAAIAALWLGYGALRLATLDLAGGERATVGVVQASVPQSERFQPGSASRNLARHDTATRALAAAGPLDLVVWSETAVDIDLDRTPSVRRSLETLAREIGVPIVTGAPRSAFGPPTNAVVLVTPDRGLVESYDKQRLVPFSEFDPPGFGWLAALVGPVVEGDPYLPGAQPTVFTAGPIPFSTPVCFEITYPNLVSRFRASGAELLVNVSNDAWFGRIGYPEMHLDHAILRAVEMRSTVVRGANTGISAVIDPAGRVVESLPVFTEGTLRVEVAAAGAPPLYARTGDAPLVIALVMVAAGLSGRVAAPGARPRRSESSSREAARARAR
jgi:apolipoprotein N-acyltransferase